jgi:Protein of unknown function (DUF559)
VTTHRRFTGGLFVGSHAVAEGWLTKRQLDAGPYRRVLRNVYTSPDVEVDHRLKARAAALLMPSDGVIAGRSAAAWFGAPFSSPSDPVLVVVPRDCRWKGPRGVQVHKSEVRPDEVWVDEDGLRLTSPARTAWEIATLETVTSAVVLLDGMLRQAEESGGELSEALLAHAFWCRRGRWGSRKAGVVLPLLDGRAMSPPESRLRVACHFAGLPEPVPQFSVFVDGVFLGQVDLAWPEARLVVEYEGEYHFEGLQITKDDARYARLTAAGWRVVRLSSFDLRDMDAVVERLRGLLEQRPTAC